MWNHRTPLTLWDVPEPPDVGRCKVPRLSFSSCRSALTAPIECNRNQCRGMWNNSCSRAERRWFWRETVASRRHRRPALHQPSWSRSWSTIACSRRAVEWIRWRIANCDGPIESRQCHCRIHAKRVESLEHFLWMRVSASIQWLQSEFRPHNRSICRRRSRRIRREYFPFGIGHWTNERRFVYLCCRWNICPGWPKRTDGLSTLPGRRSKSTQLAVAMSGMHLDRKTIDFSASPCVGRDRWKSIRIHRWCHRCHLRGCDASCSHLSPDKCRQCQCEPGEISEKSTIGLKKIQTIPATNLNDDYFHYSICQNSIFHLLTSYSFSSKRAHISVVDVGAVTSIFHSSNRHGNSISLK